MGLLALPCGIGEFSCVPLDNEEEKTQGPHNYQQLLLNFSHLFLANGHLVGGWATPLKNMKVNWDDYSQYMEKYKMATKPPTSLCIQLTASTGAPALWVSESNCSCKLRLRPGGNGTGSSGESVVPERRKTVENDGKTKGKW